MSYVISSLYNNIAPKLTAIKIFHQNAVGVHPSSNSAKKTLDAGVARAACRAIFKSTLSLFIINLIYIIDNRPALVILCSSCIITVPNNILLCWRRVVLILTTVDDVFD